MTSSAPTRPQAARLVRDQLRLERRSTTKRWLTVVSITLLVISAPIGWSIWNATRPLPMAVPMNVTADGGLPMGGDGPVPVALYLDFGCQACRDLNVAVGPALSQLVSEHRITLTWHPLALFDSRYTSAYSTRAANAVACANDGGHLSDFGQALLTQLPPNGGPGLSDDQLIDMAGYADLNAPAFSQCVRDLRYRDWLAQVTAAADNRGVAAAPTVLVNGRLVNSSASAVTAAVASAT
jgi:protein-disulfide isomerase